MKTMSFAMFLLTCLAAPAFAEPDEQAMFEKLKTLDGTWEGTITAEPPAPQIQGKTANVSLRTMSLGNSLVHEMKTEGLPDRPVTLFYLDAQQLMLTHYCDAGNRPRMAAKLSPDGKSLEFEFVDLAGGRKHGYMHRAVFTFVDADHHIEEWTYMTPGDKPVRARFELRRTGASPAPATPAKEHSHGR